MKRRLTYVYCLMRVLVALLVGVAPLAARAQEGQLVNRAYATRAALEEQLLRLGEAANSPAYSPMLRSRTRLEADLVRRRLAEGDFQVGDRILLTVENEPALSDTFTVDPGRVLTLPTIGDVSMVGVLRSEMKSHLEDHMRQFLRDPIVRARSLIRISVLGGVGRPGFYTVPGEMLLTGAIMLAGGPSPDARIEDTRVERGTQYIWEGGALQEAMAEGQTLDQLGIRAGDRVFVPPGGGGIAGAESAVRTVLSILSIPISIFAITRVF